MRASILVSAAVLALSASVAGAGYSVDVEYPEQDERAGLCIGAVAVSPVISYDVGYAALPTVGSVSVDVGAAVARRLAVAIEPCASPFVGRAEVEIQAQAPATGVAGGASVDIDAGVASLHVLAQMLLVTPSYAQPYFVASLLIEILRDLADAIVAVDAVVIDYQKAITDGSSSSDALAISYTKVLSDQVTATDLSSAAFSKALADAITATDGAPAFNYSKVLADSVTAQEVVAVGLVMGTIADSSASSDSSVISFTKNLSDAMSATDAITGIVFGKNLTEVVTAVDVRSVDFVMGVIADQSPSADAVAVVVNFNRTFSDLFTSLVGGAAVNEQVVNENDQGYGVMSGTGGPDISFTKVLSDSSGSVDSLTGFDVGKVLADTSTAAEAVSKSIDKGGIADSSASADQASILVGKNVADSVGSADTSNVDFGKVLADATTAAESVSKEVTKVLADTSTAADVATPSITFTRNFGDILTSLPGGAMVNEWVVNENDQGYGVMSGNNEPDFSVTKVLSESMTAADVISAVDLTKPLSDSSPSTDSVVKSFTRGTIAETVGSSDASTLSVGKNLSESMTAAETTAFSYSKPISESVSTIDVPAIGVSKPIADATSGTTDSIVISFNFTQVFEDQFTSLVNGAEVNEWPVNENDQGYGLMAGNNTPAFVVGKNLSESMTASDSITSVVLKALSDAGSSTDAVAKSLSKPVADSSDSSDSTPVMAVTKVFSETVTAGDAITISIDNFDGFVNAQVVNGRQVN